MAKQVVIDLPYDITTKTLEPDPGAASRGIHQARVEFHYMIPQLKDDEMERVMRGAVALYDSGDYNIWQCLETALIWERG